MIRRADEDVPTSIYHDDVPTSIHHPAYASRSSKAPERRAAGPGCTDRLARSEADAAVEEEYGIVARVPPNGLPAAWCIETVSGSRYRVRRDATGAWWLSADSVANPYSNSPVEGEWSRATGARCHPRDSSLSLPPAGDCGGRVGAPTWLWRGGRP